MYSVTNHMVRRSDAMVLGNQKKVYHLSTRRQRVQALAIPLIRTHSQQNRSSPLSEKIQALRSHHPVESFLNLPYLKKHPMTYESYVRLYGQKLRGSL